MFLSLIFIALIFNRDSGKYRKHIPAIVGTLMVLAYIPIAVSRSFFEWYSWMWISFIMQGAALGIMIYLVLSSKRYKMMNILMCVLILLTSIQGLLSNLYGLNMPSPLQYGFIAVALLIGVNFASHLNDIISKNQHLEIVSKADALTGAYNRRIIDHLEYDHEDCIILLDIDDMKRVNDNFGHHVGDQVLKGLVKQIGGITRKSDVVIRMGGDEFCVIMKGCTVDMAKEKMDQVASSFRGKFSSYGVNISYGYVMYEESLDKSLTQADASMYQMKSVHKQNA